MLLILGDVQTAVCVWLVLQPLCRLEIPEKKLEAWCLTYVELLKRHRLHVQSALVSHTYLLFALIKIQLQFPTD